MWWRNTTSAEDYEWGLGAGTSIPPYFYHADAIENNPGNIVSPHIIAGFLGSASLSRVATDLSALLSEEKGVKTLIQENQPYSVAWRYSLDDAAWTPDDIQGIDYASMLLGLASLPQHLGDQFFSTYNNFSIPLESELPVELTHFDGFVSGRSLTLQWTTASEQNNAGFFIELLQDNAQRDIAFVQGAGTTAFPQHYTYTLENQPTGSFDFRLRQVDFDGTTGYSSIVTLTVTEDEISLLSAYPNPFNPVTTIPFSLPFHDHVNISVYDIQGNLVQTLLDNEMQAGQHDVSWNAAGLPSGMYYYSITTSTINLTRSVVLVK